MQRRFYLDLADAGLAMPIGTDLVLRAQPDAEAILLDGTRLGQVLEQAARRFDTPLALPTMDLELEKQFLLQTLGVPASVMPTVPAPWRVTPPRTMSSSDTCTLRS